MKSTTYELSLICENREKLIPLAFLNCCKFQFWFCTKTSSIILRDGEESLSNSKVYVKEVLSCLYVEQIETIFILHYDDDLEGYILRADRVLGRDDIRNGSLKGLKLQEKQGWKIRDGSSIDGKMHEILVFHGKEGIIQFIGFEPDNMTFVMRDAHHIPVPFEDTLSLAVRAPLWCLESDNLNMKEQPMKPKSILVIMQSSRINVYERRDELVQMSVFEDNPRKFVELHCLSCARDNVNGNGNGERFFISSDNLGRLILFDTRFLSLPLYIWKGYRDAMVLPGKDDELVILAGGREPALELWHVTGDSIYQKQNDLEKVIGDEPSFITSFSSQIYLQIKDNLFKLTNLIDQTRE